MRGWVGIAFEDCELTADDSDRLRRDLERCHLFVVQDGKMSPMDDAVANRTNHPIEIGARLPGTPLTTPSMRIRTRRFVLSEQARSIDLRG